MYAKRSTRETVSPYTKIWNEMERVIFGNVSLNTLCITFRKSTSWNEGLTANQQHANIKIISSKPHYVDLAGSEAVYTLIL